MGTEEFEDLVVEALHALAEKDEGNDLKYGLAEKTKSISNIQEHTISFYDKSDILYLTATIMYIGSYHKRTRSWLWAWQNKGLSSKEREESAVLKELTMLTGQALFSEDLLENMDPLTPLRFTALAVKHFGALGSYNYGDGLRMYVAIMKFNSILH
jgi:hypothetical protein